MDIKMIAAMLDRPGSTKSRKGLAAALGRSPQVVTELLNGGRQLKAREIPIIEKYLGIDEATVPLVGYVSAGATAHFFSDQGELGRVRAPDGSTEDTVAVEIRGDSLGSFFDRWIVFYDDVRRPVTADLLGQLCVVGTDDGRILIKKIQRSRTRGLFHLLSQTEAPILDIGVEWAARVKNMVPR